MPNDLESLTTNLTLSGELGRDVRAFLVHHGCPNTAAHCAAVAAEAGRQATRFGEDVIRAESAGLLHDVSAIFPPAQRAKIAHRLGLEVLPEEEIFPMIIHQKLSVVLAQAVFGVTDTDVLSAAGCHTTLKAGASRLDKVVFVADKIAWDQPGRPPYLDDLLAGLENSLDGGVFVYLDYLWQQRASLRVVHPWLAEAYREMKEMVQNRLTR
jgi:predicted HD superfamily hydrolase involved in NAD metabolism